ncbi:hypothetical protein FJU08_22155 [Martelella alba]|uniref:Transcriptional activator TraM n=1 Tax=Martelella alba TaxID=2590451 RepID=A0A506TYC4_9HYPH|nr:hypothetical protein [Martelella alba]TPW26500.1 hypothetical protein FJU08_22155 [Martelella alba]
MLPNLSTDRYLTLVTAENEALLKTASARMHEQVAAAKTIGEKIITQSGDYIDRRIHTALDQNLQQAVAALEPLLAEIRTAERAIAENAAAARMAQRLTVIVAAVATVTAIAAFTGLAVVAM